MKIALALGPDASAVSTFGTQCGVEHAVGTFGLAPIPDKPIDDEAQPFSRQSLARFKAQYEQNGYHLSVIESRPPMEKIKLAQPGRDEEIAVVCEFIRNMGAVGIPVWCPAWMPILFVIRTSSEIPTRGGAKVTGFDLEEFNKTHPADEHGEVSEEDQWDNLKYFLARVVPVAEEAGVKL
ncbi:MAG: mannonate dehydratase, partial [Gemmatimonadetes bacterium]|nr:mannonate dehydratase [Gemmatimonadota bacterium]